MGVQAVCERYERDGFAFPVAVISGAEAATIRADLEAAEAELAADPARLSLLHLYPARLLPSFDSLVRHPRVLDVISGVLGPDLMVWSSGVFIKEPRSPAHVSWHQDLTYWGFNDAHEMTAWIALTRSTTENGCMRFIPGSHEQQIVAHVDTFDEDNMLSRGQEVAVEVDEALAVDVVLRAGEASVHHGRLFHSSGPNKSLDRRIGVAVRYIQPSMQHQSTARPIVSLARGEDRHGNFTVLGPPAGRLAPSDLERCEEDLALKRRLLYERTP